MLNRQRTGRVKQIEQDFPSHVGEPQWRTLGWDFFPISIVGNNARLDVDFAGNEIPASVAGNESVTVSLVPTY
jgi:hypothetical protein